MCEHSLSLKQHTRVRKHAKSFTNIFDMFRYYPYEITAGKRKRKRLDSSRCCYTCSNRNCCQQEFVVSDKLNISNNSSHIYSVFPSTSTIFYDLDDLANRHSFHCITDLSPPRKKYVEGFNQPAHYSKKNPNFKNCSTHLQYISHDSSANRNDIEAKRVKKKNKAKSETKYMIQKFENEMKNRYNHNFDKETKKPLCYTKYTVQYSKSKQNKPNNGYSDVKRVEDSCPCPCQLFSYVCPCTENKSHLTLSKSKTFVDQITSTIRKGPKTERKAPLSKDSSSEKSPKKENIVENEQPNIYTCENGESVNINHSEKQKRSRKYNIKCPKCRQVFSVHSANSEQCPNGQSITYLSLKNDANVPMYSLKPDNDVVQANIRTCTHDPQCEMVPACQILPTAQVALAQITRNNRTLHDRHHNKPRVIRVTKACRHHPPCTVVPSCQREFVMENHCDTVPPCMHKPRCMNLPICVPIPNQYNINDAQNNNELYYTQPPYSPYIFPMQPRCEVPYTLPEHNIFNQTKDRRSSSKRSCVTDNKSCQCMHQENKPKNNTESGSDAVIYIRDVGCQFRNKSEYKKGAQNTARESTSSCDINKVKVHNYENDRINGYTNPRLLNQTSTTTSWSKYSEKELDSTYDVDWKHLKKEKRSPTLYKEIVGEQSHLINKGRKKAERKIEVIAYPLICDNNSSLPLARKSISKVRHQTRKHKHISTSFNNNCRKCSHY